MENIVQLATIGATGLVHNPDRDSPLRALKKPSKAVLDWQLWFDSRPNQLGREMRIFSGKMDAIRARDITSEMREAGLPV